MSTPLLCWVILVCVLGFCDGMEDFSSSPERVSSSVEMRVEISWLVLRANFVDDAPGYLHGVHAVSLIVE